MDIQTVTPFIKRYIQNINEHIKVSSVLLYGSLAEKRTTETSDIDLLVLSEDFTKLDPDERSKLLYRSSVGFPYDLHVYGVTFDELQHASPLTTLGKIKQGKTIHIQ